MKKQACSEKVNSRLKLYSLPSKSPTFAIDLSDEGLP